MSAPPVEATDVEVESRDRAKPQRRLDPGRAQRLGLLVVIAVLVISFGSASSAFYDQQLTIFPLLRDISILCVVGLAQLAVMSIGHMNLAVGRMAALSAMVMGLAYQELHLPLYAGLVLGLLVGAAIGALTGWIISATGVNSFVVTLAMDFVLLGLVSLVYAQFTTSAAFTVKPAGMDELRKYSLADVCLGPVCGSPAVPQLFLFTVVAMLAVGWLYSRTRVGRELLLVGSNIKAAQLSGIPTGRRVIGAHALSGTLAGLAGFMLAVTAGSFTATIGSEFMIPSFLGPVLGGTLLTGGAVSVIGTLLGITLTQVIRQGLTLLGVGLESLNIYLGAILLLALSTGRIRTVLSERKARTSR
ncbi:ABC transporter permease [Streptomyces sp. ZAF1911]|uniref:ABC transporter permease n=1 Tax=Streptomyces sp. ZAF1911 TaxID=2944129 RepID=UPI00237A45AF|nr:ABC transporter permease [Streptomyces sp. ZAF1911]MDD9375865.1 ABC transporter permease [Streptomyces sp. ZAF1911]